MARILLTFATLVAFMSVTTSPTPAADWKPVEGKIMTRWAKEVTPEKVLPEYPRPQLVRDKWVNLNGLWDYAIRPKADAAPATYDGKILVPYPVESALSGVGKNVGEANHLWYRRSLTAKKPADGGRWLLHFGAVDWRATVFVNGQEVGQHEGGYDPFSIDITGALKDGDSQELVVRVWDPTDKSFQPRGKQVSRPGGIWYTAVTGIWQTAWLEPVPANYVKTLTLTPDVDKSAVKVSIAGANEKANPATSYKVVVLDGTQEVAQATVKAGETANISIPKPKLWSPDQPFLYNVRIEGAGDQVTSYFGLRKIALAKDKDGINRLMLNNEPLFQFGPLDQGWWPDGLYTAPTDAALRFDVEYLKALGCNMIRKHVKVEPLRWYYHCDQLGVLVWQDMPSGDKHIRSNDPDIKRATSSDDNFVREWKAIIDALRNAPSIVMWVPFNEGWGQFDTERIVELTKQHDPTRLVNNASGWTDRGVGDVHDIHVYPGPGMAKVEEKRASVLGEFGGLGLPLEGHSWLEKGNWGYRSFKNNDELIDAYSQVISRLRPLIGEGLCAAVYTQTTDVEVEVNGMMTYDRAVEKIPRSLAKLHKSLYLPPPKLQEIIPTSQKSAQTWQYTTTKPADDWYQPNFKATDWKSGPGGFGTASTPGAVVHTEWKTDDIWIRRTFELKDANLHDPAWFIHHDEDAEIYLNGEKVGTFAAFTSAYSAVPMSKAARAALKVGQNTIAVHCKQTKGGQYIDVGIVDAVPVDAKK